MHDRGLRQGYYIGLFFRFLYQFVFAFLFQALIFYIFNFNFFTFYILSIVFSFFINTSLPMGESYPFFRHSLIYFCLLVANSLVVVDLITFVESFYTPTLLWKILILVSIPVGVAHGIGRYGNGLCRKMIENYSNLILLVLIIIVFATNWWEGGLTYLILRMPMMFCELSISNSLLYYATRKYDETNDISPL